MATHQSTARLEAFSDGVIAVIITIMVLELKVPIQSGLAGLYSILPTLLVYLLSFAFTGIYWVNHDHLLKRIQTADRATIYANLVFLFWLSLLPFFTNYVFEKREDTFSVALYALSLMATGFAFFLLRLAVIRRLRFTGQLRSEDTKGQRLHFACICLYALAVFLANSYPYSALVLMALITLPWVLPNLSVSPCEDESERSVSASESNN
jgi:uncharacterized membrane protein